MNQQRVSRWGGIPGDVSVNTELFTDTQPSSHCDAWRARIATTLLTDLSEEERGSLAEHLEECSACATLFREYQFVEELIRKTPQQDMYVHEYEQRMLRSKQRRTDSEKVYTL